MPLDYRMLLQSKTIWKLLQEQSLAKNCAVPKMIFCTTSSPIKIQKAITFVFFSRFFNSLLGGGVATTTLLPQDLWPQNHITQQHSFHKLPYLPQQSVDHSKDLEREIQISCMCLSNSNLFQFEHIKLQIYISKELKLLHKTFAHKHETSRTTKTPIWVYPTIDSSLSIDLKNMHTRNLD